MQYIGIDEVGDNCLIGGINGSGRVVVGRLDEGGVWKSGYQAIMIDETVGVGDGVSRGVNRQVVEMLIVVDTPARGVGRTLVEIVGLIDVRWVSTLYRRWMRMGDVLKSEETGLLLHDEDTGLVLHDEDKGAAYSGDE